MTETLGGYRGPELSGYLVYLCLPLPFVQQVMFQCLTTGWLLDSAIVQEKKSKIFQKFLYKVKKRRFDRSGSANKTMVQQIVSEEAPVDRVAIVQGGRCTRGGGRGGGVQCVALSRNTGAMQNTHGCQQTDKHYAG